MKIISNKEMLDYVEGKLDLDYNLLLTYYKDTNIWVACDNSTNNKWVEEFDRLEKAIQWLKGEYEL